jgi:hypothetical protein
MGGIALRNDDDGEQVENAIRITSVLLWVPHVVALVFTAAMGALSPSYVPIFATQLILVMGVTYYAAMKLPGDWLMGVAAAAGLLVELSGFGIGEDTSRYELPNNLWIMISAAHGLFGGILAKAKDIHDGRYVAGHTIAERLYLVVPFAIGLWFGYVMTHGWSGVWVVFMSIFFCQTAVGYCVVVLRVVKWAGVFDVDLIQLITRLFTSSFGAVLMTLVVTLFLVVYIALPFMQALWSLNALVSTVGIIVEVIVYDLA